MAIEIAGLADIVRAHGRRQPDVVAIVYEGRITTYGALDRAASRVANALIAEGVRPQARVAHLDKSNDLFFELLFGVAKANAVIVSVNWRLAPPELLHIINDAEAEILIVGEEYFPVIAKIRDELKTVRKVVAFGRHAEWESFTAWRDRQSATDPNLPTKPTDTAVQFYTSGTTGAAQGRRADQPQLLGDDAALDNGCWRQACPTSSACRCFISAARAGASPACSRAPPTMSCASSCRRRSSRPSSASGCRSCCWCRR
jgi:acyl-coenzyme A synthetase/AMP-(fatty) acid ligase